MPFVVVTTIFYVTALLVPVEVTGKLPLAEAWRVYLYPYVHFWFLQAIALIFAVGCRARPLQAHGDAVTIRNRDDHRVRHSRARSMWSSTCNRSSRT